MKLETIKHQRELNNRAKGKVPKTSRKKVMTVQKQVTQFLGHNLHFRRKFVK